MNYSISNLTVVADCDALLSWAAKEQDNLNFKKWSDERLTERYGDTARELDGELQGLLADISATQTVIDMLPEGNVKQGNVDKMTRLVYKKFLLDNRRGSYNTVVLLEKEMDLGRVSREVDEVSVFIESVKARKAELEAPR